MESGDTQRMSSPRISSSNIWSSGRDIFSRSYREEDDEAALQWAAIERLPTYRRLERGILTEEKGQSREIDIKSLRMLDKKKLLERLVSNTQDDNEKFLLRLKGRIDRVGLQLPTIEVRFEHLNVDAEAYVGGRALPTVFNFCINVLEGFLNYIHVFPSRKKPLPIIHDISGIIKPGRMTLLLGPPASGKTTLLLALAGKLGTDSYITVQEFAEAFQSFPVGQKLGDELAVPYEKSKSHPNALTMKKYGISKKELLRACISREYLSGIMLSAGCT